MVFSLHFCAETAQEVQYKFSVMAIGPLFPSKNKDTAN
jgi:hypothetical protein